MAAAGCNLDSGPGSSNQPVEGEGRSPATDPGSGQGGPDGEQGKLSDVIITPLQNTAPTLPAAIITPSPATVPVGPPDIEPEVPMNEGPPVCGNMAREEGEICDSSVDPCCAQDCSALLPSGTLCRDASGTCDVAEVCNGESRTCPQDRVYSPELLCRASNGQPCDAPEFCTGETKDCPSDRFAPAGTVCGQPSMPCDEPEVCDGETDGCPPSSVSVAPATQECRPANGVCDAAEHCDGISYECPVDLPAEQGKECRAINGACDAAEVCTGESFDCPDDAFRFDESTPCRPANPETEPCGLSEYCFGQTRDCPPDEHRVDTLCRSANPTTCDRAEFCDGQTAQCPADGMLPSGSQCNGGLGTCSSNVCCPGATRAAPDALCTAPDGGKVVFVSSSAVPASVGIASADKMCNDLARSANLAGNFRAWLSSSALRAGGALNRVGEGPYVRVDNLPVAASKAALTSPNGGGLVNGISLTQWGEGRDTRVWTGTSALGTVALSPAGAPVTCADWTNNTADAPGEAGVSTTIKPDWTQGGALTCNQQLPVYCFPEAPPVNAGALVFVTRSQNAYLGDGFASVANADNLCTEAAAEAKLSGTWIAWLSDGRTSAGSRIIDRPYFRPDGKRVATSLKDLIDGTIESPIEIDQFGEQIVVNEGAGYVWTGTKVDGNAGQHCSNWTRSDAADATIGRLTYSNAGWTDVGEPAPCNGNFRLYCFQNNAISIDGPRID